MGEIATALGLDKGIGARLSASPPSAVARQIACGGRRSRRRRRARDRRVREQPPLAPRSLESSASPGDGGGRGVSAGRPPQDTDLLSGLVDERRREAEPLAARMRPRSLDEVVGQRAILGPGGFLRAAVEEDRVPSMVLYGPPPVLDPDLDPDRPGPVPAYGVEPYDPSMDVTEYGVMPYDPALDRPAPPDPALLRSPPKPRPPENDSSS